MYNFIYSWVTICIYYDLRLKSYLTMHCVSLNIVTP
jgi:hypothetical protein